MKGVKPRLQYLGTRCITPAVCGQPNWSGQLHYFSCQKPCQKPVKNALQPILIRLLQPRLGYEVRPSALDIKQPHGIIYVGLLLSFI